VYLYFALKKNILVGSREETGYKWKARSLVGENFKSACFKAYLMLSRREPASNYTPLSLVSFLLIYPKKILRAI